MVVQMDLSAKGEGDVGRIFNDPVSGEEEASGIDPSLLETIPSWIPTSCIYRYQDFTCTRMADGFYGDIYKVQHRETKEVMVLKMNKPDVERDTCTMLDEIKLMSRLSHENVIRFLGICVDDSKVHLLCEFVNGGDLESLLLKHSVFLDWTTRLYLARDIAEGMRYLHKNGIIHRDLTTKNCLIKERNRWRYGIVADLGLATQIKEQSIVGSPYNMAPELLRGENYDEKADVFSYGIILCEIIGRVPADPDELPRTNSFGLDVEKFQHMTGDCPYEFLQTALCCCQMEPSSRPTFVETTKHLEYILVGTKPFRPYIEDAMDALPPKTTPSSEQNTDQSVEENKHELNPEKDFTEATNGVKSSSTMVPPAIIVSTDASPGISRSAEKRRQSWIAGRYKLFNTATDDLLSNTPSKLKSFFHRVLRVQTHFDPSKPKKIRDNAKQRSASHLKSYSIITSQDEGDPVKFVDDNEQAGSGSSNSTSSESHGFLHRKSSKRDLSKDPGVSDDSVDGSDSPHSPHLNNVLSSNSPTTPERITSPKLLDVTQSLHSPHIPNELDTPVSKLSDNSNRPRCKSTPLHTDLSPGQISRRTASHRECEMNNAVHPDGHDKTGKIKNKKSSFWFLRRKGSKCKDVE